MPKTWGMRLNVATIQPVSKAYVSHRLKIFAYLVFAAHHTVGTSHCQWLSLALRSVVGLHDTKPTTS